MNEQRTPEQLRCLGAWVRLITAAPRPVSSPTHAQLEALDVAASHAPLASVVTGLETFGQTLPHAQAGDNATVLLRGIRRHQVRRGQVITAPGSVRAWRRFTAQLRVLTAAEGGRRTAFATGYRPQFHVRTADTVGLIDLGPGGVAQPGSTVTAEITLGRPLPLTSGLGFAVREGGRTVAAGAVTHLRD